jgi:broad specificity phosphatase PhoE
MRLLLIRHGQTPNNVRGALDTAYPGAGLTDLGRAQARAVPDALREERIAGIHVSRLVRTHETAAPLAAELHLLPRLTEGLEEIPAGDLEMERDEAAVDAYQENQARWGARDFDHALPGGESGHRFWERYTGALRQIAALYDEDATVAVVSHGAAIRVFSILAAGLAPATREDRPLFNTGMVTLTGHPDQGWELTDWVSEPIGGAHLLGDVRHDVTADATADAAV